MCLSLQARASLGDMGPTFSYGVARRRADVNNSVNVRLPRLPFDDPHTHTHTTPQQCRDVTSFERLKPASHPADSRLDGRMQIHDVQ